ncbi:MAG: flagellar biosynthesis protein FlhB [Bacteriovoracaceae bacterium]|nr:flagellar biosynthesis protein FlhB [Bacteriovoracaceae bacterium]
MADEQDNGEKTEEPSQYKIDEARKNGDVASSRELNSIILLSGTLMATVLCGAIVYEEFTEYLSWLLRLDFQKAYQEKEFAEVIEKTAWLALKCVGPVFGASACLGFISQFAQVGFLYSPDILTMKFDRVNPIKGFGRLFSKKSIVEVIKGIFKFTVVLSITYMVMKDNIGQFLGFLHSEVGAGLLFGKYLIFKLGYSVLLGLGVIALGDFAWEKWSYRQKMMMTKQQAKDEHKDKDGNPEIKQKIRSIQRQMAQKRMMDGVKKADVIVTNPTHISVALKYDGQNMIAPEVMAKGSDLMALKIREIAQEHDIPIVENVLLARTLYSTVKVGQGVPRSLYRAVAEVLSFVYKLKRKKKALKSS